MSFGNEREFIDLQQLKERRKQAMKCPLFFMGWLAGQGKSELIDIYCLKEECALWDEGSSACAIWSLMSGLDSLGKLFREIEKKMPHAGQFTK